MAGSGRNIIAIYNNIMLQLRIVILRKMRVWLLSTFCMVGVLILAYWIIWVIVNGTGRLPPSLIMTLISYTLHQPISIHPKIAVVSLVSPSVVLLDNHTTIRIRKKILWLEVGECANKMVAKLSRQLR